MTQAHAARPPAVVVVAYGPPELLARALEPLPCPRDVIVVDNGRDDVVAAVTDRVGARYLRPPGNVGFAAAVNLGLAQVPDGRDVLLLNPDARLPADGVAALQEALHASSRTAAVAPLLRRPDGRLEPTSWPLPTPWQPWLGAVGLGGLRSERFLSGAVLLLRGEALVAVGGFDERFFLYAEESDWQRRAQQHGWSVRTVAGVEAEHAGGATSSDPELRDTLFHASAELFVRKWYGSRGWAVFRLGSALAATRRWLLPGLRDREVRRAQQRALRLYLRGPVTSLPAWARR